jgi:hypothetical protein
MDFIYFSVVLLKLEFIKRPGKTAAMQRHSDCSYTSPGTQKKGKELKESI